ncbi:MAG: hypothetical protein ACREAZ_09990 [Nitrososphaera sp.]
MYFKERTGLKNRRTLWKKLRSLYEKDIVISHKSYGKETYVTLVKEDTTIEVFDSQTRDFAVLFQEFKGLYDDSNINNEQRVLFMIKLAHVLFFARLEVKVVANRMNERNKAGAIAHAEKVEELYHELTDFLVDKCNSNVDVSSLFIRQMPPVIGSSLADIRAFVDAFKAISPAAPGKGPKKPKSKNPKN